MSSPRIFYQSDEARVRVPSLTPFLMEPWRLGLLMDAEQMRPDEVANCRWLGFGIGKGVTHAEQDVSIFAAPTTLACGLHGALIQDFDGIPVDPSPACYEPDAPFGFNAFVRWVFFARPDHVPFFGIDFGLGLTDRSGVANSMWRVFKTVEIAARHGIPTETELVLLNPHMCEDTYMTLCRQDLELITVRDWLDHGPRRFARNTVFCARCGQKTFTDADRNFCVRCGFKRHAHQPLTNQGGCHGL